MALVAGACLIAGLTGCGIGGGQGLSTKKVVVVFENKPEVEYIDLNTPGTSLGDMRIGTTELLDINGGHLGYESLVSTLTALPGTVGSEHAYTSVYTRVLTFDGRGQVFVSGSRQAENFAETDSTVALPTAAIIGGTDEFSSAAGTLLTSEANNVGWRQFTLEYFTGQ